ncbi:NAD-dependent epimerase/dehydratase family protein [Listeria booriae]|uniref:NAD-dependent epimerase/dehydratase family protein n=1 Tax=Listeria booriae TaxID=1552123 RepID=UPI001629D46F|nr:NAD-dependent epimerase/dehydratase family protein [Listeria booriae]MBC2161730.1 NAD-dependent epimerase/dehydratase family protein [Listeria booriae]MBC2187837.1 NAD-dependent epimerase/dehydratase family protein [Listeria booriae]MBC2195734.1 NAD-dependent epimerase/dehydratase family protein [Listeria booriae]
MSKNKILITGGCGFIGSRVIELLADSPHDLYIIDNLSTGSKENIPLHRVELAVCDIRSMEAYDYVQQIQPDYVIHLAAQIDVQTSIQAQQHDADINIMGTLNIIQACVRLASLRQFVFASTAAVYGNNKDLPLTEQSSTIPTSPYGQSKLVGEQYLALTNHLQGLPYAALRFANVYGKKSYAAGDVITSFWTKLQQNEAPIIFGDGEQTRDFIYVEDIAKALIEAMYVSTSGVYNISTNEQTSINDVLNIMNHLLDQNISSENKAERAGDIRDSRLANNKFVHHTTWTPEHTLKTGLQATMHHKNNQVKVENK